MSWAANNPEKYEEICIRGIIEKLGLEFADSDVNWAITEIANACPKAFSELCSWAAKEIAEEEADARGL